MLKDLENFNIENFYEIIFNNIILHYETPSFAENLLYLLEWLHYLLQLLLVTSRFCTVILLGLQQTTFHVSGLPLNLVSGICCYTKTKWKNTSPFVTFSHHLHYTLSAIFTEAHSTIRRNLFFHFVCSVFNWLMHCVCVIPVNFEPGYSGFWSQNIAKNLENNITHFNPTLFSPS